MEGIKDLKNLALEAIEKRSSLLKNEKYIVENQEKLEADCEWANW